MTSSGLMLITGAGRGIGAATARLAAHRGFAVCVNFHLDADAARSVVNSIRSSGGRAIAIRADIRRASQVKRLFEQCDARLGVPTVVVNNAACTGRAGRCLADTDPGTIREIVDTNLSGTLYCAREAVRRMQPGGQVINLSSTATRQGSPGDWVDYAATKGAIDVLTGGLARETAAAGIRVNAVAPGLVDTELHARAGEPDRLARFISQIPMGRAASPDEIAEVIVWLAADAPKYLTGAVIPVSGGR